jgi:hypothetical protein
MNHMILPNGEYAVGKFVPEGSILVPAKPNGPYSWNGSQWIFDGYTTEDAMNRLRFQRNRLLAQTDWWVLPDRTPTQAQLDYRQALRDLPANSSPELDANGQLINVNWPEKPE